MSDEELKKFLEEKLIELENILDKLLAFSTTINNNSKGHERNYYLSLVDKAIKIIDGYKLLLPSRNLTCISILVRVQLDNCMRTLAGNIADDPDLYFSNFFNHDMKISRMKDKNGKKLTDANLRKYFSYNDESFQKIYSRSSEFVHLSDISYYTMVSKGENNVEIVTVGDTYDNNVIFLIPLITQKFIHYLNMQLDLLIEIFGFKADAVVSNINKN